MEMELTQVKLILVISNFSQVPTRYNDLSSSITILKFQDGLKFRPDGFPAKTRLKTRIARTILQLNAREWKVNRPANQDS